jgi:hypothetical protein
MGQSAVSGRGLAFLVRGAWLVRGARPAPLPAWIVLGFLALGYLGSVGWRPDPPPVVPFDFEAHQRLPRQVKAEPPQPDGVRRVSLAHGKAERLEANLFYRVAAAETPDTFQMGQVTITLASAITGRDKSDARPTGLMLRASAPGVRSQVLTFADSPRLLNLGVGRMDLGQPGPQVLFTIESERGSCCTVFYLLTVRKGGWRLQRLGSWTVDDRDWPIDRDGDGAPELMLRDERFPAWLPPQFREWTPPRFVQVRSGKVEDVSNRPGFASHYREHMVWTERHCREGQNFACTAMVAAAGRIGEGDRAWKVMLDHYDRTSDAIPWVDCDSPAFRDACKDRQTLYPVALRAFLDDNGYWPARSGRQVVAR